MRGSNLKLGIPALESNTRKTSTLRWIENQKGCENPRLWCESLAHTCSLCNECRGSRLKLPKLWLVFCEHPSTHTHPHEVPTPHLLLQCSFPWGWSLLLPKGSESIGGLIVNWDPAVCQTGHGQPLLALTDVTGQEKSGALTGVLGLSAWPSPSFSATEPH